MVIHRSDTHKPLALHPPGIGLRTSLAPRAPPRKHVAVGAFATPMGAFLALPGPCGDLNRSLDRKINHDCLQSQLSLVALLYLDGQRTTVQSLPLDLRHLHL